ncbi:hypothetical protein VTN00DRAFT_10236 [Thermoascus crustaceus]|uniref:uncharacterized protein n=1 Tax=Thermoascus crustaceus TaxID=5088 RepID=UPI00374408E0
MFYVNEQSVLVVGILFLILAPAALEFAFDIMQVLPLATIKLSILFLYRRVFIGKAFNIVTFRDSHNVKRSDEFGRGDTVSLG